MEIMSEHVLDAENWKVEAEAVKRDIEKHVNHFQVLNGTNERIYFDLTTLEGVDFCIELSARGFRVVGNRHGDISNPAENYFETPYSLLSSISPAFHQSFANQLLEKLNRLTET